MTRTLLVVKGDRLYSADSAFAGQSFSRLSFLLPLPCSDPAGGRQAQLHETGRRLRSWWPLWWVYAAKSPYGLLGAVWGWGNGLIAKELELTANDN